MLKISVTNQSSEATNFQLEGKLVGPWVEELRRLSDSALATSEAVSLDLEKVWFVDSQGIALLQRPGEAKGRPDQLFPVHKSATEGEDV